MVLFIMPYKAVLTFESLHVVLNMLFIESVGEIFKCDH